MKIVGKMGNNYMITIPREELLELVFGYTNPQYNDKLKPKVDKFSNDIDRGNIVDISVHNVFKKAISLANTKISGNYDTIVAKLDAIKGLISPIELFISELNTELNEESEI